MLTIQEQNNLPTLTESQVNSLKTRQSLLQSNWQQWQQETFGRITSPYCTIEQVEGRRDLYAGDGRYVETYQELCDIVETYHTAELFSMT